MADFFINSTVTTTQTLNLSDNGFIGQNGAILVDGNGVNSSGSNDVIVNGTIAGWAIGLHANGSSIDIVIGNLGSILSSANTGFYAAVSGNAEVLNAGLIGGDLFGLQFVSNSAVARLVLNNSGTILGETGVRIDPSTSSSTVANSGLISGSHTGINANHTSWSVLKVTNTGTISGVNYAFTGTIGDTSSDRVYNSGLMEGDIVLDSGNDIYKGIFGTVTGLVQGGDGDDILKGGAGAETLDGGADADNIHGNGGDDELIGGTGNDTIRGNAGDDTIFGGSQSDVLHGGRGDDEITTGGGDDVIVFKRPAGNDTLTDFNDGRDVIDLQAFNLTNWGDLNGSGAVTDVTGGVEIDFSLIGGTGILTIAGISVSNLGNPDFIF